MTASVTMRMWHSVSPAFWRPDPRRDAEPREPSYVDKTPCRDRLPRRLRSSPLRACGAGRLALEQIRQRGLPRPWVNPRTCACGCRRGSKSYPQFRCTNLTPSCAQTPAVNRPQVTHDGREDFAASHDCPGAEILSGQSGQIYGTEPGSSHRVNEALLLFSWVT